MGRIKTTLLKRTTQQLMKDHGAECKDNFGENKLVVSKFLEVHSKKFRNIIAGYMTRLVKARKTTE